MSRNHLTPPKGGFLSSYTQIDSLFFANLLRIGTVWLATVMGEVVVFSMGKNKWIPQMYSLNHVPRRSPV